MVVAVILIVGRPDEIFLIIKGGNWSVTGPYELIYSPDYI